MEEQDESIITNGNLSFTRFEAIVTYALSIFFFTTIVGLVLLPSVFYDQFVGPYIWEPILGDATQGDTGYNWLNTVLFSIVLFSFVISISALLRKWKLPHGDNALYSLIPWVILASLVRVLEDSDYFNESIDVIFISPLIHFHLATWIIISGIVSTVLIRFADNKTVPTHWISTSAIILISVMWLSLFWKSHNTHAEIGTFAVIIGMILACETALFVPDKVKHWHPIESLLFVFGVSACFISIGYLVQFSLTPWSFSNEFVLWPLFVVLTVPTICCSILYYFGKDAHLELTNLNLEPGVLPENITIEEWEKMSAEEKGILEKLSPRAILASPLTLAFTFGQLCDGIATWLGVDFFKYSEKHVVGAKIMEYGKEILWEGAWLFLLIKTLLVLALIIIFGKVRVEYNQQHLRLLVVIALLVVGLAPGLRDVGRLILGV